MKNQLQQCVELVKEWAGNDYLYFDSALQVKHSPHHPPVTVWGVCVSPADALYIMDDDQQWHELEAISGRDDLVIASVYQRLTWLGNKYAKAS